MTGKNQKTVLQKTLCEQMPYLSEYRLIASMPSPVDAAAANCGRSPAQMSLSGGTPTDQSRGFILTLLNLHNAQEFPQYVGSSTYGGAATTVSAMQARVSPARRVSRIEPDVQHPWQRGELIRHVNEYAVRHRPERHTEFFVGRASMCNRADTLDVGRILADHAPYGDDLKLASATPYANRSCLVGDDDGRL